MLPTTILVDELFSLLRKGRAVTADVDELRKINTKSITKSVDDSTMMFGCLVSNTIPTDKATTFVRNMERVYASFVEQYLSQNQMIDVTIDRSPIDYLRRIHQNVRLESAIDMDALDDLDKKRETFVSYMESAFPDLEVSPEDVSSIMEGAYNGEYKLYMDSLGKYGIAFKETKCNNIMMEKYREEIKEHLSEFDLHPFPVRNYMEANDTNTIRQQVADSYIQGLVNQGRSRDEDIAIKRSKEMKAPQMLDRDVKKANDMQPYAIQVRLMAVNDKKEFIQYLDFIVGVKAVLHPIESDDLVMNISYILQNKNFMFNMIRWATGEISLFKNIILNIDEIRFDAANRSSGRDRWIPTLKRLKNKRVAVGLFGAHKIVPNSTMVVTSYEVDRIKEITGVDLRDPFSAKKVIDKIFLIAFVIMDEGTDTMDILYDSRNEYQTYSMESLEKEVALSSSRLNREIGRMISR